MDENEKEKSSILKKWIKRFFKFIVFAFLLSIFMTILYRFLPVYFTPLMAIRALESTSNIQFKRTWVPMSEISTSMMAASLAAEDSKFLVHYGFDVEAIEKAYNHNQRKYVKVVKGASSISQQTAKNVFLYPHRTYFRKALETYFTVLIETFWGKKRILEVYLNVIEFGPGIYGVEAASQHYFKKKAKFLTDYESMRLAAILPAPRKSHPNRQTVFLQKRIDMIARNLQHIPRQTFRDWQKN